MDWEPAEDSSLVQNTSSLVTEQIRGIIKSKSYLPDPNAKCCPLIPSRRKHKIRTSIGFLPGKDIKVIEGAYIDGRPVYQDSHGRKWKTIPCYCNCCNCSCSQTKLIAHSDQMVDHCLGSTELQVIKMNDGTINCVNKTYNYRDKRKAGCWVHFLADILPICLYCSNVKYNKFGDGEIV